MFPIPLLTVDLQSILVSGLAYLDPGSGSIILQLLLAALLGGAFLVKTYWQKITRFVRTRLLGRQDRKEE